MVSGALRVSGPSLNMPWLSPSFLRRLLGRKVVVEAELAVALEHQTRGGPAPALEGFLLTQPDQGLWWTVGVAGGKGFGLVFGVLAEDEITHLAAGSTRALQVDDHVRARPVMRQALSHAAEHFADRLHLGRVRLLRLCGVKRNQRGHHGGEKHATHDAIILR